MQAPRITAFVVGAVAIFLAGYYYVVDLKGYKRWAFPFLVVGMNSIAMYVVVHVATEYVERSLFIHLGRAPFEVFGAVYVPIVAGATTLLLFWLMLLWMYRNRVFVRI